MPDILDAIDGALTDYATSPDAMRWSPEPETVETTDVQLGGLAMDVERFGQAMREFGAAFGLAMRQVGESLAAAFRHIRKMLDQAEQPPTKVRTHAAARTRSAQWRAGSRRTKRLARR